MISERDAEIQADAELRAILEGAGFSKSRLVNLDLDEMWAQLLRVGQNYLTAPSKSSDILIKGMIDAGIVRRLIGLLDRFSLLTHETLPREDSSHSVSLQVSCFAFFDNRPVNL